MPRFDPLGGPWGLGRSQNLTFSEYGHAAHQIKENEAYINMLANNLPFHTTLTPGKAPGGAYRMGLKPVTVRMFTLSNMNISETSRD